MVGKLVSSRFVCRDIACKLQVNISKRERQKLLSLEISSCQSWNAISLCYLNSCNTTILLMSYFSYFEGKTMSSSKFYLFDSLGLRFSVSFFCVFRLSAKYSTGDTFMTSAMSHTYLLLTSLVSKRIS